MDFNVSQPAPVANAQSFYSTTITLEECFLGQASPAAALVSALVPELC